MDYEDVYYTDGRNAVRDHRIVQRVPRPYPLPGIQAGVVQAPSAAPGGTLVPYNYPPAYPPAVWNPNTGTWGSPNVIGNPGLWGYPTNPPYSVPPTSNLGSIIGGFGNLGSLASIAAQVFAALLPLPASPTPQDNNDGDPSQNAEINSANLIRYQGALAQFARRDQQILTIGSVLRELLKRPGYGAGFGA